MTAAADAVAREVFSGAWGIVFFCRDAWLLMVEYGVMMFVLDAIVMCFIYERHSRALARLVSMAL